MIHAQETGRMPAARFDVALVDAGGQVGVIENARRVEQD